MWRIKLVPSVEENLGLSIPWRSLEFGISQRTLHPILHKDFCLKAYKVQFTQESQVQKSDSFQ